MKIFCYSCGSKIEYAAANKPKFCMNCGAALDPSNASKKDEKVEQDDLDSEEVSFSGNISKLDFDFEPQADNKVKLSDALGSSPTSHQEPRLNSPEVSKEEFQKQWEKEAGSLRSNPSQHGNE